MLNGEVTEQWMCEQKERPHQTGQSPPNMQVGRMKETGKDRREETALSSRKGFAKHKG